ncbi:MAG: 2,3-bisphosphoglycerate-independent phosphoglycerate mutase [Candidatus Marinimicrobia bacterium]|nr:2,3-bisphosphoglycerate-independent phosphoglycerate mutase [Candidatus Neomarinimicrobiota bacterium]
MKLERMRNYAGPKGPVVLVIMDGVGIGAYEEGDLVRAANTPTLDWLAEHSLVTRLKAHGRAVGLPTDEDMGNSEVGHNAIGCGRVFEQGAALVNKAIAEGSLFQGAAWQELLAPCRDSGATLHFLGLLSDGNVHSHIDQLEALLRAAQRDGARRVRVHILLDGRDVPPTSALDYVARLETFLQTLNADGGDFRIASGGGRMGVTMDRYEADWRIVERGWRTHVQGQGRGFASAREAIETFRGEKPGILDQDLPPFVITAEEQPVGAIRDGDSVIFFNFRGDRAIEISRAFEEETFTAFDRGPRPQIRYAGMMQYDGDLHIPSRFLVSPPALDRTLGEYLARAGVRQMAISETQKFGHVTYFFNGNRSGQFDAELEEYIEVPSDQVPFEERPWMKAAEITDRVIASLQADPAAFIRLNYPNGDMVGHTGVIPAVRIAVEAVDLQLSRLLPAIQAAGGILVLSADHGNSDDMYQHDKKTGAVKMDPRTGQPESKTSHSLNPVPCYIYDPTGVARARLADVTDPGIASLAATCLCLLGFEPPPDYAPSLVDVGD